MQLIEVVIPPDAAIATHSHPGMQLVYLESGTIDYTVVRGSIRVRRAPATDGSPGAIELFQGPRTVQIDVGDSFVETRGMVHSVVNRGTVPAVIIASSLFDRDEPANIPAS
jgi:quercetin dioxygenase-like cupin family protein